MWKDTEYFKNKGGEFHTGWNKFRAVTLRLKGPVGHFFCYLFCPLCPQICTVGLCSCCCS